MHESHSAVIHVTEGTLKGFARSCNALFRTLNLRNYGRVEIAFNLQKTPSALIGSYFPPIYLDEPVRKTGSCGCHENVNGELTYKLYIR